MTERRYYRSEVRVEALARQFDQVALEGGFDLVVLTGESGEPIACGSVMDQASVLALSAFGASALRLQQHLTGLLPLKRDTEILIGDAAGAKIHLKFFEFNGQRLVVAARAFKPRCDPALLNRLCTGAKRILEARELSASRLSDPASDSTE